MKNDSANTETAPATELPESVRIPLHSLQADLEYLIGRVIADGSCGPMIVKSMRERLDQIETAVCAMTPPAADDEAQPSRGTFLGSKNAEGHEMHCANTFCPHQAKCAKGCINQVARPLTPPAADERRELEMLRERLGPRGLEVVFIGDTGHYVNEKIKAEIERLRSALKPFAEVASNDIGQDENDSDTFRPMRSNNHAPLITVGDMRRAVFAHSPPNGTEP